MSDQPITEQEVGKHVEAVIDDMAKGRVVPKELDRLDTAIKGARTDQSVGRAIGSTGHGFSRMFRR